MIKRLLFSFLLLVMLPSTVFANPAELPNPAIVGTPHIFLEVSQTGSLNALDAPFAYAKLLYSSPNGMSAGVFDGCYNQRSGLDGSGMNQNNCQNGVRNANVNVLYEFYPTNANEDPKTSCKIIKNGYDMAISNWTDFGLGWSGGCAVEKANASGRYEVLVRAYFQTAGPSGGRVNAFKLRSNGFTSYFAKNIDFDGIGDRPFSVQRRFGSAPAGGDTITFETATPCYFKNPTQGRLRWKDADQGPSGAPRNDAIRWELYEQNKAGGPNNLVLKASGDEMGGNNADRFKPYDFKPNHKYLWRWYGVIKANGVQVYMPFDSYNYHVPCAPTGGGNASIQGYKVEQGTNNPSGTFSTAKISVSGVAGSENANPFYFTNRVPAGSRTVTAQSPHGGYTAVGYQYCDNVLVGSPTGCVFGSGSSVTFNVVAGHTYDFRWYYAKGGSKKIYAANVIEMQDQFVRDNFQFVAKLKAYIWPDAGMRSGSGPASNRFWTAGIWGKDSGDNANNQNSPNADPDSINNLINSRAEDDCTGPKCRVPFAYVPESDGMNRFYSDRDGSTTPGGNRWLSIKRRNFNTGYTPRLGGIASYLAMNGGNQINNVEISNIRVQALGFTPETKDTSLQGGVSDALLQNGSRSANGMNLPPGSQGPRNTAGSYFNAWDNVKNPNKFSSPENSTRSSIEILNDFVGPVRNFNKNPENIGLNYPSLDYHQIKLTSLLQDGNDKPSNPQYQNSIEPLTYTAGLNKINDTRLKWDEYVDWDQIDDKGHYYPQKQYRPTGAYRGYAQSQSVWLVSSVNTGYPEQKSYTYCSSWSYSNGSWKCNSYSTYTYTTSCYYQGYPTSASPNNRYLYWYDYSTQSRYGWKNTSGGSFNGYESTNPPWALTNPNNPFWQDKNITPMNNASSSKKPAHNQRWIYDTSDPLYSNRALFDQLRYFYAPNGVQYYYSYYCVYPNGGGANYYQSSVYPVYPNQGYLYENGPTPYGEWVGRYNFTFDGRMDGNVDVAWGWVQNYQRVRYEQTYTDRFRRLGARDKNAGGEFRLWGHDPNDSVRPARGMSTITNPKVELSNADIYAGGKISSYFRNSNASSAFLFSGNPTGVGCGSVNFANCGFYFANYFNNPDREKSGSVFKDPDPIRYIFRNYDAMISTAIPWNPVHAGALAGRVFVHNGDLTLNATTFCNGQGTIIVRGVLTINGNINYCGYSGADKNLLPSVGFIVEGNPITKRGIEVAPNVSNIKGAFFTNHRFNSGSVLFTNDVPNGNTSLSDGPFALDGLIVARNFALRRQLSGSANISSASEQFRYDGRVIIAPPPGFSHVYNAPAAWNEGVPRN